ncbi:putative heme oxygenase HO1 [Haematococcus lacustris]
MLRASTSAGASSGHRQLRRSAASLSPCVPCQARGRCARLAVLAHGAGEAPTATRVKPEKEKGFINEMRMVAMKLHTRDQAPKEGQQPAQPMVWTPTRQGYLKFLAESKVVYDALEAVANDPAYPEYAPLRNTGLERSQALAADLEWFKQQYGLEVPPAGPDSPGAQYAAKVTALAKSDPPAFICHYYNFYFAHTAGGRMIGNKVSEMLLDKHTLAFYQWSGDVAALLDAVRVKINSLAEGWSREQKDHCLAETQESFKMSGVIMRCITEV